MISVEVIELSNRQEAQDEIMNNEWRSVELDFLLKVKEQTHLWNKKHKALIAWAANKKMKTISFLKGTLALRQVDGPHKASKDEKLAPN